jgi:hypothetical protein
VYDPKTGGLIRSIPLNFTEGDYKLLGSGRQIIWLPQSSTTATTLIDVESGLRSQFVLPVSREDVRAIAPDSPRIIARSDDRGFASYMDVHTLVPGASTRPVRLKAEAWWIDFSPDGKRILTLDPRGGDGEPAALLTLVDAQTGEVVGGPIDGAQVNHPGNYFVSPDWMLIPRGVRNSVAGRVDVFSARTGQRTHSLNLPTRFPGAFSRDSAISDDGALFARANFSGANNLEVYDLATGARIVNRPTRMGSKPKFFPNSHRLISDVGSGGTNRPTVIDPTQHQPLAILPCAPKDVPRGVLVRADGRMMAMALGGNQRRVAIYEPTGRDCPESPLGALAFLQTWATALFFGGFALCLFRDARRVRGAASISISPLLTIGLVGITALLTLAGILAACLGRVQVAAIPAPVLFVASVGLATHARVWRLLTLIALCATVPWSAYQLYRLRSASNPFPWTPLDRTYEIPRTFPLAGLILCALLGIVAIILLATKAKRAGD